ncbi:hypothetical protein [Deinococcus xianganensis]|uniref:Alpha/beta hydrolase n=1 Tax=Deinococcus xianganensis TaxID=1507289 RepID=A0A6I4YIB4_9DEIO|nr:hypothetical protein [Deinococcus xianganensis]MXV21232.1 hypothetical protein [Deinococcus xianganensis]
MNRTPLQVALAVLLWTVLTACGGSTPPAGGGSTPPGGTPPSPPPPVDTTYSIEVSARDTTLPGRDSDGNGVRDDLDGYITQAVDPAAQVEARAYSRLTQRLVTSSDPSTLSALLVAQDMALTCLASKLPDRWAAVAGALDDRTLNNEARTLAYWATMRQAAGLQVPLTLECDPAQMTPAALTLRPLDVANTASSWSRSTPHACAYRIVFINGIQNDRIEARLNLLAIMKAMGPVYEEFGTDKPGHAVQYGYIYNPTVSLTADLTEALRQKLSELNSPGWWLVNAALRVILGGGASQSVEVTNLVKQLAVTVTDLVAQELVSEVQRKSATTYEDDIVRQAAQLIGDAAKVQPVVIVAHSQGNLIANAAWWKIKRDRPDVDAVKNVHIVSVGTPASGVANGVYVTREADRVMAAVRVLQPGTLPANNATSGDLLSLNHNFESAYMSGLGNVVPSYIEGQFDSNIPTDSCFTVSPKSVTVQPNSSVQLLAEFKGLEPNVGIDYLWKIISSSSASAGSVDNSGFYKSPDVENSDIVRARPVLTWMGQKLSPKNVFADYNVQTRKRIYILEYNVNVEFKEETGSKDTSQIVNGVGWSFVNTENISKTLKRSAKCDASVDGSCAAIETITYNRSFIAQNIYRDSDRYLQIDIDDSVVGRSENGQTTVTGQGVTKSQCTATLDTAFCVGQNYTNVVPITGERMPYGFAYYFEDYPDKLPEQPGEYSGAVRAVPVKYESGRLCYLYDISLDNGDYKYNRCTNTASGTWTLYVK